MRALRTLLILLVLLGGLFVGADRLAVGFAEDEVAARIKSAKGLSEQPSVEIHGFPFLTQILGKELDSVDATLDGLTVTVGGREVEVTEVDVALSDVRLENNFSTAVAARATGSARITYTDLSENVGEGYTIGYAGAERAAKNQVKVEANAGLLGRALELTLHSTVSVADGDTVRLHAEEIPEIPLAENLIRDRTDLDLALEGLPAGLKLEKAEVDEKGVVLHLTGTDVNLAG